MPILHFYHERQALARVGGLRGESDGRARKRNGALAADASVQIQSVVTAGENQGRGVREISRELKMPVASVSKVIKEAGAVTEKGTNDEN